MTSQQRLHGVPVPPSLYRRSNALLAGSRTVFPRTSTPSMSKTKAGGRSDDPAPATYPRCWTPCRADAAGACHKPSVSALSITLNILLTCRRIVYISKAHLCPWKHAATLQAASPVAGGALADMRCALSCEADTGCELVKPLFCVYDRPSASDQRPRKRQWTPSVQDRFRDVGS